MKRISALLAQILFFSSVVWAQEPDPMDLDEEVEPDSIAYELPRYEVDSLVRAWYRREQPVINDFVPDSIAVVDSVIAGIPDQVFIDRLQAMLSPIPMPFNKQVRGFIDLYVVRRRNLVRRMLSLAKYYFPLFEQTLERHGMPQELKYMAVIESALNPNATSRVGAAGLWQFMYYTGKRYGLDVTSYVDERRDPIKASEAAALFLHDLYVTYGDWHLAIAAYNCGPGNVNRAIARSGGKKDFWQIYYNLPKETRGYVPAFIAAAYTMTYAQEHQLYPSEEEFLPMPTDTVVVYQPLHFNQVTSVIGTSADLLRRLNPEYKHDVVPAQELKLYSLVMPAEASILFAAHEDSIYARDRSRYFPDNRVVNITESKNVAHAVGRAAPHGKTKLLYTVRQGDVPGNISRKFGVRLQDLVAWNGIRHNIIRAGQRLVIYVPSGKASRFAGMAKIVK